MADKAHMETDKKLEEMERHLSAIYSRAGKEVQETADEYFAKFIALDERKKRLVLAGKLDPEVYKQWRTNKILYSRRFDDLQKQISKELLNANKTAMQYINDQMPLVYCVNYNALAEAVDGVGGYSFTLVDPRTVKKLATEDETLLPYKYVDGERDVRWNTKKVNAEVLQGILQGDSIPKIAGRLQRVTEMNEVSAVRNARTSITSAECKGRQDSYVQAQKDGIRLQREWIATVDGRTRHAHRLLDGQIVDVDQPFEVEGEKIRYPGDPTASPHLVYNCRCTIAAKVIGFGKKAGKTVAQTAKKVEEKAKSAVSFVCDRLKNTIGAQNFQEFSERVMNSKAVKAFEKFSGNVSRFVEDRNRSYFQPGSKAIHFDYCRNGRDKYSTLAHEMGHSFDQSLKDATGLSYGEVDALNMLRPGRPLNIREKVASSSDQFLKAVRADKSALDYFTTINPKQAETRMDLLTYRNISAGVQDAFDGFFATQDATDSRNLPWGHGSRYYNRFYTGEVKFWGLDKELKQLYKDMGFDASNQTKVRNISRDYETASELFANINSAYTVGGKELEFMEKYLPNACEAYLKIVGGIK